MDVFVWFLAGTALECILVYLDLIQPGRNLRRHLMSWVYGRQYCKDNNRTLVLCVLMNMLKTNFTYVLRLNVFIEYSY